jgi:hypothetical protein
VLLLLVADGVVELWLLVADGVWSDCGRLELEF